MSIHFIEQQHDQRHDQRHIFEHFGKPRRALGCVSSTERMSILLRTELVMGAILCTYLRYEQSVLMKLLFLVSPAKVEERTKGLRVIARREQDVEEDTEELTAS